MFNFGSRKINSAKMFSNKVAPYKINLIYLRPQQLIDLKIKVRIPKFHTK